MRNIVMIAALLSLAGCGGDEKRTPDNDTIAIPENATVSLPAPPAEPAASPSATPTPLPSPTASEDTGPVDARIPRSLRGRWGLVPADCTSKFGDAKGLLVVSGETLRFYESVGTLDTVAERDDSRIVGDFDFTGEGEKWRRRVVLDGQDNGQTLIRRELGDDAMPGALRYRRCA